ncbi:MAG: glycosyltransferase family 2 protein [Flavobacteriaceae bacterium]|nr:glycosyltransferase family 2 protein [Flavobacteriaceae bacterium]
MKKLAVLLPTYNAAPYLKESVDSILNQTFADFDLYIFDDCSTDSTSEILSEYKDTRLHYRKNLKNIGIAKTLNKGLEELLPLYEFIARMDADDWAYPERFKKQLDYLEQHQEVVLCGTQGYWIKDMTQNPISGWKYPVSYEYIKIYLLFAATFGHSSVMIRGYFFNKHNLIYNETISTCEDWDLWIRVAKLGKISNLPDFMMKYRILENSNHRSPQKIYKHLQERSKIISEYWTAFDIELSSEQIFDFYYNEKQISNAEFINNCKVLIQAFNSLYENSCQELSFEEKRSFSYMLARKILNYWKRSKVSRIDAVIWWTIVKEVRFMNKMKLIKSIIR